MVNLKLNLLQCTCWFLTPGFLVIHQPKSAGKHFILLPKHLSINRENFNLGWTTAVYLLLCIKPNSRDAYHFLGCNLSNCLAFEVSVSVSFSLVYGNFFYNNWHPSHWQQTLNFENGINEREKKVKKKCWTCCHILLWFVAGSGFSFLLKSLCSYHYSCQGAVKHTHWGSGDPQSSPCRAVVSLFGETFLLLILKHLHPNRNVLNADKCVLILLLQHLKYGYIKKIVINFRLIVIFIVINCH